MIGSICDTVYESIKSLTPTQIVFIILIAVAVPAIVKLMCERNVENYVRSVDASSINLGTQLLYSYKLNAATRFFVGYSDQGFQNDIYDSIEYTNRTFFAKFSYAWQP